MSYAPRNILNIDYLAQTNSNIEVVEGSLPTAGDGLTASGTSFSVNADGTSLEVVSDVLRVKADGIGTTHVKRWQDWPFLSTTDSDATTSGAITTLGGIGVAKNLNVGGTVKIDDVTNSTSASTGSFRTLGGVGVTKDLHAGGQIHALSTTPSAGTTSGSIIASGGIGCAGDMHVGGAIHGGSLNTTGDVTLTGTSVRVKLNGTRSIWLASASGDGAGDFHIWDNTSSRRVLGYYVTANQLVLGSTAGTIATIVSGTHPSTSKTSGALQVAGGAGIGGDLWATNITATGNLAGTLTTPAQTNITSVGTLTSLTVAGEISGVLATSTQPNITSVGTLSSLVVSGGGSFGGAVSVATPSLDAHATTKAYVDAQVSAGVLAGTGLTKTGSTLSVNASQTQITSVGALSSLAVTGETTTNGLVHTDGGSVYYKFRPTNNIGFGMSLDNTTTGATTTRLNMCSSGASSDYTSVLYLHSFGLPGGSNQARLALEATPTEYRLYNAVSGSGTHKPIIIGGTLNVATTGVVSIQNTLDTSGSGSGSLQVAGGAYIAKKLHTNGDITTDRTSVGAGYVNVLCTGTGVNANTDNASGVFLNSHAYTGTGITGSYILSRKVTGSYRLELRSHNDSTGNNELYQYTQNNGTYFAKNIFPNGSETVGTSTHRWSGMFSTGFNAKSNTSPQIQVQPVTDGNETSMIFYRKGDASTTSAGDVWCLGQNVDSVGAGNFAVYTHITGKVLEISSAGLVTAPKSMKVGTGGTATQCVWHGLVNAGNSGAPNDLKGVACTYGITLPNVDYRVVCSAELTGNRNGSFAVSITNKTTSGCTLMVRRTDPDGAGDGYWSGGKGWNFDVWISVVVYQP